MHDEEMENISQVMEFELHTDASNTTSPFVGLVVLGHITKRGVEIQN
jgi:hypothetical protein